MTEFQKNVLSLIHASLTDSEPRIEGKPDLMEIYRWADQQQIVPLIYNGMMKVPALAEDPSSMLFFERTCVYIGHSADQTDTADRICAAFEEAGITHMPLKGTLLKSFYPSPEMRVMGDSDILIKTEEYDRIVPIMESLGCTPNFESNHEYGWKTATGLQLELHKRLIPSYNEDYYAYYGDGWRLTRTVEGCSYRYEMSPEDTFVYLFTHFAKHYRDQGVGIKYALDFFVFLRHYESLDIKRAEREMKRLQLYDFYRNVMRMLRVWFEGEPSDDVTDLLTDKLFFDGVFGNAELNAVSEGLKMSKSTKSYRVKKVFQMMFPPSRTMRIKYPVLNTWAILMPIFWIVRLFDVVFIHRDRVRKQKDRLDRMSDERVEQYRQQLNFVGLDYNFGEDDAPEPEGEAAEKP